MLGWDRCGVHKKHAGTRYAELVFLLPMGSVEHVVHSICLGAKPRCTIFHAQVVLMRFPQKPHRERLRRTCVFASGGICGSHSVCQCFHGAKRRCTTFHARVGPVRITQKVHRDTLHRNCVFASGGRCGARSAFCASEP
jgi:hypothetical protein